MEDFGNEAEGAQLAGFSMNAKLVLSVKLCYNVLSAEVQNPNIDVRSGRDATVRTLHSLHHGKHERHLSSIGSSDRFHSDARWPVT